GVTSSGRLAGRTCGLAGPTRSPAVPSTTTMVAGWELWLSTVTVHLRAFGGTGPSAGGSGVGTGGGLGGRGGPGLGKAGTAGRATRAGTYSSPAPADTHPPF